MNWNNLTDIEQLNQIDVESKTNPILIYKHSTRCGICDSVKDRLERDWENKKNDEIKPYYLDLLQHRNISNEIAERYKVEHESPQVLIISEGRCIYSDSQTSVRLQNIQKEIERLHKY